LREGLNADIGRKDFFEIASNEPAAGVWLHQCRIDGNGCFGHKVGKPITGVNRGVAILTWRTSIHILAPNSPIFQGPILFFKLFLAFSLIPVIELYLIIKIGTAIGALNTIAVVIITAIAGAHLARMQGMQTMMRVRHRLNAGEMPADEMVDAMIIFMAGVVLLTPGFVTDLFGLLLLFPPSRKIFKDWITAKFKEWSANTEIEIRRFP
jgi:UPF0716 protein FxsA